MDITDFFEAAPNISVEEVRAFLKGRDTGEVNLVDVRQPSEYENQHLPGARLIPLGELGERLEELDPGKRTIVYCASGGRSRAAVQTLKREGFGEAYSMDGGIKAWKGLVAEGIPEAGLAYFSPGQRREDFIYLSWNLEEGTRTFYDSLTENIEDQASLSILKKLVAAEEAHKATLRELFERSSADPFDPYGMRKKEKNEIMEGGMAVDSALAWARGKALGEVLELSMSLEANAYDRYVLMSRAVEDEGSKEVFIVLSGEEKVHLDKLTALFEDIIAE